jgi:tetratricopeptide (TPR) repeat protein
MLAHVLSFANRMGWLICLPMMHIEELVTLTTRYGFSFYSSWAQAYRGRSLVVLGQVQEGLALLTQAREQVHATGGVVSKQMLLTWLAEAYAKLGQFDEERKCLAQAARIVETTEERVLEAELLHRVPGDLLNAVGDQAAAEQHYRQAIAVAERQSAKLFQLRASVSLARLWRDQGKRAEVCDLIGPLYNWFTEGFDAPDLKDAKALLDELA